MLCISGCMKDSAVKLWRRQAEIRKYIGMTGKILSHTVVRVPVPGHKDMLPYVVGMIRLDDNQKIVCQVVGVVSGKIKDGLKIRIVLRRVREPTSEGVIPYGIKAELI